MSSQSHDEFVEKLSDLFMNISNYHTNVEEVDTKTDTEQSFEKKLEDQVIEKNNMQTIIYNTMPGILYGY